MAMTDLVLAIVEAETMRKRDEFRATIGVHAEFPCDPSANLPRRARFDPRR
jgi:hypothetical protein